MRADISLANNAQGQGTPPYHLYPIGSGDKNGTSLETIPIQLDAGVYKWRVDFNSGANLTWVLVDAKGLAAYSDVSVSWLARRGRER